MSGAQEFRKSALSALTDEIGVYALCDLDGVPMYGKSPMFGPGQLLTSWTLNRSKRHCSSALMRKFR
jgi:hypothetical protein